MPELPECDAIAGVARKYAKGNSIIKFEVVRWNGKYFSTQEGPLVSCPIEVSDVYRIGKTVEFKIHEGAARIVVHNAMTGYFDWEHEPWTFHYVEADRVSDDSDVRVKYHFADGKVLRFHDTRLFGSMRIMPYDVDPLRPELIQTPHGHPNAPIMTLEQFYRGLRVRTPIKVRLMDQSFVGGIGNIYSVEALHAAGIHPSARSDRISPEEACVLHAALVWSVDHSIPQVRYDWLNVYRRTSCGTCGLPVKRYKLGGRATFVCESCQPDED